MQEPDIDTLLAHALDDWHVRIGRQFGALSRPQRRILHLIARTPGLHVGVVADRLGLTTAGATRMVDKLEALGYAYRFRAPGEDQRHVRVALTAAGEQALAEADRLFVQACSATLAALTVDERETLSHLLYKILDRAPVRSPQQPDTSAVRVREEGSRG